MQQKRSLLAYFSAVIILAALSGASVFLQETSAPLPASLPVMALVTAAGMLVLYGGVGYIGLLLARKLKFAEVWDDGVTNRQRFLIPGLTGAGLGVFLIVMDLIFSRFNGVGRIPHPGFPLSLIASATAGIGEEILFRLFLISFWVWAVSFVFFKNRYQDIVFWVVTAISALAFSMSHMPSLMLLMNVESFNQLPPVLITEIALLNSVISFFAAYHFRRSGFLAAVSVHFWADIVWHAIWGLL